MSEETKPTEETPVTEEEPKAAEEEPKKEEEEAATAAPADDEEKVKEEESTATFEPVVSYVDDGCDLYHLGLVLMFAVVVRWCRWLAFMVDDVLCDVLMSFSKMQRKVPRCYTSLHHLGKQNVALQLLGPLTDGFTWGPNSEKSYR